MSGPSARRHVYFRVVEPNEAERILVFDSQQLTVGRAKENDLRADYAEMSRRHAVFARTGQRFSVQNLSTSNGTLVNGSAIDTHVLQDGDVVQVAEVTLTFCESPENPAQLGMKLEYASQLTGFGPEALQATDGESTMLGIMDTLDTSGSFEVRPANDFEYDLNDLGEELAPSAPAEEPAAAPRDLDLELEGFGLDDLEPPDAEAESAALARPRGEPSAKTRPIEDLRSSADEVWTLDDEPEPELLEPVAAEVEPVAAEPEPIALESADEDLLDADEALELDPGDSFELREAPTVERPMPQPPRPEPAAVAPRASAPAAPSAQSAPPAPSPPPAPAAASVPMVSLQLEIEGLSRELEATVRALLGKVIELPNLRVRIKGDDLG